MRIIAGLGAFLFAYLAIIPAGLVASTLDPACAGGECETPLAQDVLFVALYGIACLAVAGCAGALGLYAMRPSVAGERKIRLALVSALATIGATLFALFALTEPLAALAVFAIGATTYTLISRNMREEGPPASSNGHGRLNGHPG